MLSFFFFKPGNIYFVPFDSIIILKLKPTNEQRVTVSSVFLSFGKKSTNLQLLAEERMSVVMMVMMMK